MEYHGQVGLHPHETSQLSENKEHLPHAINDHEMIGNVSCTRLQEDKDHVASTYRPSGHPSSSDDVVDDDGSSNEHEDGSTEKDNHNIISDSSKPIDVILKDSNNANQVHNVNNPRLLPQYKGDDDVGNSTSNTGARNPELPLEDSASNNYKTPSIKTEDLPSSSKEPMPHDSSSTSARIMTDFTDSLLLRSRLTGPQLTIPPLSHVTSGIPQRPLFMLPPIPPPYFMLPHQMPQWPIVPLQSGPPNILETDFIRFSALRPDSAIQKPVGSDEETEVRKEQSERGRKRKKYKDDLHGTEDLGHVRYKTEYRKTNRASTMLLCDKIKLPHKKPRVKMKMNLVDISDGPMAETNTGNPIADCGKGQKDQDKLLFHVSEEKHAGNVKIKTTTSKKTGAKQTKKGKTGVSKKLKIESTIWKVKNKNEQKMRKGKKVGVKKQFGKNKSQQLTDAVQPPRPKKKVLLTPEKILYNKLTQVVKQIAEPNIFSPLVLPPNLKIQCSCCDIIYPDRKSLWEHIQIHLKKPVPFRLSKYYRFCKVCRKYVSEIRDHIRAVHFDGGTPYGCPKCQERFRYKGLLRNHIQNRHTTARNYMCEVCGLAFKQSVTLRKHKMVHTDEKNFFCTTCGKAFKTMYALQKHVVVHAIVKPFRCEICDKQFTQQTNMKSHMRTHTGEKPYQCDLCTMAFTHNVSLKTHKKKHHGVDMWKDPNHSQTCKLVASSQPNVKLPIQFINEMNSESAKLQELELARLQESELARLFESESARLLESGSARLAESESVKLQESESAKLQESESARLQESESAILAESESVKLQESAKLQESESPTLQESESATLQESESARLAESESVKLQESESATLQESESATLQESVSPRLQESETTRLQESAILQESELARLRALESARLQELTRLQESEQARLQALESARLQES